MRSLYLNEQYAKFILLIAVIAVVLVLSGMTESSISQHIINVLPANLNNIQGQQIFSCLH